MPSPERFEFHIRFHKLLIGLLLSIVPISLAGLYSITHSDKSLEKMIGSHFKTIAGSIGAETSQFIHERVVDVAAIAIEPDIVDSVSSSNRAYASMNDEALTQKIRNIDKIWNTPAADPMVREILASNASRSLRRHRSIDPKFLRITVTDEKGCVVAATHKTLDYYQADEEYWQNIYAEGRGSISLTDVLYDEATKSNYIGVGVPIVEEGSNKFIGTVDALVDVSSLFPVINRVQLGGTGRTLLVKDDATVIAGPQVNLAMKLKSDEFNAIKEAASTPAGRQTGYVVADLPGTGRHLIGFADTGLKQDYRNLGWFVLVAQETREAFAPTRVVGRLIAFVSLLGLAIVTFIGAYFALHRRQPMAEIGELRGERGAPRENETVPRN